MVHHKCRDCGHGWTQDNAYTTSSSIDIAGMWTETGPVTAPAQRQVRDAAITLGSYPEMCLPNNTFLAYALGYLAF